MTPGIGLKSEMVIFVFFLGLFSRLTVVAAAQTSLAEIILRLNTGLVGIITSFLNSDKKNVDLDYRALTDLSERSRIETCHTLRQLCKRLTHTRRPLAAITNGRNGADSRRQHATNDVKGGRKRRKEQISYTKVREPMLARVMIENSSRPSEIAMVRPGERRKKSQSSSSSGSSSLSKAKSQTSTDLPNMASTPPPEYAIEDISQPTPRRSHTSPEVPKPHRKQSAANLGRRGEAPRPDVLRATRSTPKLESTLPPAVEYIPPLPNQAQLSNPILPDALPRRRKQTPTYYSVASDQTKIGEIPLHRWAEPYDFDQMSVLNREAYAAGWPLNQVGNPGTKKKKFGLGRLFGKRNDEV